MYFKGLKINIIINVGILLITGMLITDFIITSFSKNEIIKAEFEKTKIILFHIQDTLSQFDNDSKKNDHLKRYLSEIIEQSDFHSIFLIDKTEYSVFKNSNIPHNEKNGIKPIQIKQYSFEAINEHKRITHFFGTTWGIFWKDKKYLSISYPVDNNMGISFVIALDNLYSSYREKQKVILFYILFNACFLCLVALLRFSKIIIKPIERLTNIAKGYNGENDTLYMLNPVENEFGILSSSLNSMLNRISEDKQKLENTIDELKKTQSEMIRAEKLSSIGKLSAGVAHEIGNPLGIVLGYLELLKQNNISDQDKQDFLSRSEIEIQRIDRIIKQLLNLSRRSKIEYMPNSVHDIITDTINILNIQPSFDKINLDIDLNADHDIVISDRDQLKQVFLNLILNAADALLHGKQDNIDGLVKIKTAQIDEKYSSFLEIKISDNGTGISNEDLIKIFDPFYTTKEPGAGTGLGLWVSYMIIEEINGKISAESIEGEGTTFKIMLPLIKEENE